VLLSSSLLVVLFLLTMLVLMLYMAFQFLPDAAPVRCHCCGLLHIPKVKLDFGNFTLQG
jgi:hypothetical protein